MRTIKEIRACVEKHDQVMKDYEVGSIERRQWKMYSDEYEIAVTLLAEVDRLKEALLYIEYRTRHYPYSGNVVEGIVMDTLGTDYPND